ncbi:MAG: [FeFe] hydrogenase H-cluster radical SAM maturase HydE [Anaerofustis sp.]
MLSLIDKLERTQRLSREEFRKLLSERSPETDEALRACACEVRDNVYGHDVYLRGLIEFTNVCKNDCLYCGIRKSNHKAERYRLRSDQILSCCETGYALGYRTFVLQGGEDPYFTDDRMTELIRAIKSSYPDCALTLSVGEKSRESYQAYFDAGADRYLLRHETANADHYRRLHPPELSLADRMRCLTDLKEIGFQVGCGFMVGSPGQNTECLIDDLMFLMEFQPHMVGIGPFIPHHETPFVSEPAGTLAQTLFLLSVIRLMLPHVLLPATTALGTINPQGRENGILAGANVVMPNLSPIDVRGKYLLYDNKICTGDEAAECRMCLENRLHSIGYQTVVSRGDWKQ